MAQTYLPSRRGALYVLTQAADGTYLAPTQASDKALRVTDFEWTKEGGVQTVVDDITAYDGGLDSYLGDIGYRFGFSIRLSAWPGSRNAADNPALAAVLAACPMAGDYSGTDAEFTPITTVTIGASGQVKPFSLTFLETGGDVWSLVDCVCIIESIAPEGNEILIKISGFGLFRGADTVKTLSSAGLTIADVAYTSLTPIPSRGGTLTLTGPTGSGTYATRSWSWSPGHALELQPSRTATYGFAVAQVRNSAQAALSLTVTKLDESGLDLYACFEAQTALSAASIVYGSGASRFSVTLGGAQKVTDYTLGDDAGARTVDAVITGIPATGNSQYLLSWGA